MDTIDIATTRGSSGPAGLTRRAASRTESALGRALKRWPWVVVGALVGALAGLLLGSGPQSYAATATLQVTPQSSDSIRLKQVAQTVERAVLSSSVVDAAAEARDLDPGDLAARLSAEWQTDTDVVDVTVRGSDREDVVADVAAMTESLETFYTQQTAEQIASLRQQGNQLLSQGRLSDSDAEAARRGAVGSALAARQENAASGATTVVLLDPGPESYSTGLTTPLAILLGAFAGAAAGLAAALLVPFRRRVIRSTLDVEAFLGTRAVPAEWGAAEVAGLMVQSERHDLAVVAMAGAEDSAAAFGAEVVTVLRSHGIHGAVVKAFDEGEGARDGMREGVRESGSSRRGANGVATKEVGGSVHVLGHNSRISTKQRLNAQALVLVTTDTRTPLNLLAGQHQMQAAVMVPRGRHSVGALQQVVTRLRHSDPVVVIEG